jgi:V/A-type H+-transporting ATPase subunit B
MKDGIGEGKTRPDHAEVSNQMYDSYSRAQELRALVGIVGKAGLAPVDLRYLDFGDAFEKKFLMQSYDESRTLDETMAIAWNEVLAILPERELTKIKTENLAKYYKEKQ